MPSTGLGRWQDIGVMNDIWQGVRGSIVPWVVEVDKLGEAQAVAPADAAFSPSDPQIAFHLPEGAGPRKAARGQRAEVVRLPMAAANSRRPSASRHSPAAAGRALMTRTRSTIFSWVWSALRSPV